MMEIRADKLYKAYDGKTVLDGVSFTVSAGIVRLAGRSGIGKTTLLRILLGLTAPDSGRTNAGELRWAAVFQEDRLLEGQSAEGNLRFALGKRYDKCEAHALLTRLGLGDVGDKRVREYSGGMKRRLALARALLADSDALALDEPFTGLDSDNRAAALECISEAAKTKPVFLASHEDIPLPPGTPEIHLG